MAGTDKVELLFTRFSSGRDQGRKIKLPKTRADKLPLVVTGQSVRRRSMGKGSKA